MRPLTWLEAAVAASLGGTLLAVAVPVFVRNLHASRLAEPVDGLARIAAGAARLARGSSTMTAFPETVGLTPAEIPAGERRQDPPGTWDHPTWKALGFDWTVPHAYGFAFESRNGAEEARFIAAAEGDLDGDGVRSRFELWGTYRAGEALKLEPLEVWRAVE